MSDVKINVQVKTVPHPNPDQVVDAFAQWILQELVSEQEPAE